MMSILSEGVGRIIMHILTIHEVGILLLQLLDNIHHHCQKWRVSCIPFQKKKKKRHLWSPISWTLLLFLVLDRNAAYFYSLDKCIFRTKAFLSVVDSGIKDWNTNSDSACTTTSITLKIHLLRMLYRKCSYNFTMLEHIWTKVKLEGNNIPFNKTSILISIIFHAVNRNFLKFHILFSYSVLMQFLLLIVFLLIESNTLMQ